MVRIFHGAPRATYAPADRLARPVALRPSRASVSARRGGGPSYQRSARFQRVESTFSRSLTLGAGRSRLSLHFDPEEERISVLDSQPAMSALPRTKTSATSSSRPATHTHEQVTADVSAGITGPPQWRDRSGL